MRFEIVGKIDNIQTIAVGSAIHEIKRLRKFYGAGRWRKLKGRALVRFSDATIQRAELHWYEAAGIGKKEFKIKRLLV